MGKFLSKFQNKPSLSNINNYQNEQNSKKQNNIMNSPGLKELNNFDSFDNVLSVNTASASNCIFGQDDYSLILFDYLKNRKIKIWKGHEKDITKTLYCSKIDRYLSCSRDKSIKLWCLSNEKYEMNMMGHDLVVTSITTDSENKYLISGSRDNNLNLWDLKIGKLITNAHLSRNLITDISWSNDNTFLIQSSEDKEVRLWDPFNLKIIHNFPKKQYIQSSCHISLDNNYAITTSNGFQGNGCEITIWDLRKRSILKELFGHEQTVTNAKIIQNDRFITSCSNDSTVRLWDFKNFRLIDTLYLSNTLTGISEFQSNRNLVVSSLSNGIYVLSV